MRMAMASKRIPLLNVMALMICYDLRMSDIDHEVLLRY